MKTSRSTFWRGFACLAPALVAGAVVYVNAMSGEFVYDDNEQIVKNPWVHELRYLPRVVSQPVWAYLTTEPTNYYRPVQMGIYNLLWGAFGKNPLPFHVASLLFHLLCTGVLFCLVETVSRDPAAAGGAALLFAVHPLSTEAVAWIACLPELSYAFFVLAALLLHVHSRTGPGRRRIVRRVLAVAAFLLGMLSKESAIVLLPLLFFVEIWLPRRETAARVDASVPVSSRGGRGSFPSFRSTMPAMRPVLPYVAATFGYLAVRLSVLGGIAPGTQRDRNAIDALLNAPVLFLGYLRAVVEPTRLLAFHVLEPVTSFLSPLFLGGLAGAALVAFLVFRLSRRRPDLGVAGVLTIAPLLPVLYIPAVGESAFAERYAYLSTAGMAWMIAAGLAGLVGAVPNLRGRAAWPLVMALLALPCAVRAVARNADWHDDRRLASSTLEREPRAWHMYVVLADWYFRHDRLEESLDAFEKGLAALPSNPVLQLGASPASACSCTASSRRRRSRTIDG
jgi:protein O-mannosyl-transferase